jgi:hypothetical protein
MFKNILVLSSFFMVLSTGAFADDGHTHSETVCSALNAKVCAHLGMPKTLNTHDEAKFVAHVETQADAPVNGMTVTLFMPEMGHGSAPVSLKDAGKNRFMVSNAWFTMAGKWLVKMDFKFEGQQHHIEIPVSVAE